MKANRHLYKTVIISDIHLGTKDAKVRELTGFLRQHPCRLLVLNGDIIDGWRLQKSGRWRRRHTRFIKYLLKISHSTKIVYIRGNHDDFLDQIVPLVFENLSIVKSYSIRSNDKKYYIVHGDAFDNITRWVVWVSKFGASSYDILLTINRIYNHWRRKRGLKYKSISKGIKKNVKFVTSLISNFEYKAATLARNMGYDGIICGHIHTAADKTVNGIHYLNSGDWVETMSALVEDFDGNWQVRHYHDMTENTSVPMRADNPAIEENVEMPEFHKLGEMQRDRQKMIHLMKKDDKLVM